MSTKLIEAVVTACIPDFHQTKIAGDDGHLYAVVRQSGGVPWDQLEEGQRVRCLVHHGCVPSCGRGL